MKRTYITHILHRGLNHYYYGSMYAYVIFLCHGLHAVVGDVRNAKLAMIWMRLLDIRGCAKWLLRALHCNDGI